MFCKVASCRCCVQVHVYSWADYICSVVLVNFIDGSIYITTDSVVDITDNCHAYNSCMR